MGSLPLEDAAMHVMRLVLKDQHRTQDLTRVYEAAVTSSSSADVEALTALYFCYARCGPPA
jgi:hypothetical protein